MHQLLVWSNGKKTNIAAGIGIAVAALYGIQDIWQIDVLWFDRSIRTLAYIGGLIGGAGLGHKALKGKR